MVPWYWRNLFLKIIKKNQDLLMRVSSWWLDQWRRLKIGSKSTLLLTRVKTWDSYRFMINKGFGSWRRRRLATNLKVQLLRMKIQSMISALPRWILPMILLGNKMNSLLKLIQLSEHHGYQLTPCYNNFISTKNWILYQNQRAINRCPILYIH